MINWQSHPRAQYFVSESRTSDFFNRLLIGSSLTTGTKNEKAVIKHSIESKTHNSQNNLTYAGFCEVSAKKNSIVLSVLGPVLMRLETIKEPSSDREVASMKYELTTKTGDGKIYSSHRSGEALTIQA